MRLGNLNAGSFLLGGRLQSPSHRVIPSQARASNRAVPARTNRDYHLRCSGSAVQQVFQTSVLHTSQGLSGHPKQLLFMVEPEAKPRQALPGFFPILPSSSSLDSPDSWREERAGRHPASAICASSPHQSGKAFQINDFERPFDPFKFSRPHKRKASGDSHLAAAGGRADEQYSLSPFRNKGKNPGKTQTALLSF